MNSELARWSDEQLAEELENRGQIAVVIPEILPDLDLKFLEQLRNMAKTHIQAFVDPDIRDKDTEHYMYEAVMQMFYGPDIFEKFINPHLR